jgi:hypothetical protein
MTQSPWPVAGAQPDRLVTFEMLASPLLSALSFAALALFRHPELTS